MAHSPSYWDVPVQTEKHRQYLSEFQSKNILNDQIDYLLDKENWLPTEWDKTTEYGSPAWNYGQKIADPDAWSGHRANPQALQNIWRMHGEGNFEDIGIKNKDVPLDWDELDRLYGEERYTPNMQGEKAPNWDYIDALELFKGNVGPREYGGSGIGIMSTEDAYKDIDPGSEGANVGGVNVGEELTGTGGFYSAPNIILNPANVVKKYPTAPMGPDSEWDFFGPKEQNLSIADFDDNWNMYRILPHETGHHKARRDWFYDWGDPNPGAYLEGTKKKDYYSDFTRHPMMHTMDRLLHDRGQKDMSLSKTQYQNFLHNQDRGMRHSTNRGYDNEEDWRNEEALGGHWGSGRSRIENTGRPMYQSQASRAIEPTLPPSTAPDRSPQRHHFNTGGIVSIVV